MRNELYAGTLVIALTAGASVAAQEPDSLQQGGQGHPTPDQVIGPPNAGSIPFFGHAEASPPGSSSETLPAKHSEENAEKDMQWWLDRGRALGDEEKRIILEAVAGTGSVDGETLVHASPSAVVPGDVTLHDLPEEVAAQVPYVANFKYFTTAGRVVLVDPVNGVVAAVIEG